MCGDRLEWSEFGKADKNEKTRDIAWNDGVVIKDIDSITRPGKLLQHSQANGPSRPRLYMFMNI